MLSGALTFHDQGCLDAAVNDMLQKIKIGSIGAEIEFGISSKLQLSGTASVGTSSKLTTFNQETSKPVDHEVVVTTTCSSLQPLEPIAKTP